MIHRLVPTQNLTSTHREVGVDAIVQKTVRSSRFIHHGEVVIPIRSYVAGQSHKTGNIILIIPAGILMGIDGKMM